MGSAGQNDSLDEISILYNQKTDSIRKPPFTSFLLPPISYLRGSIFIQWIF
jgi:hypothetical protein